MSPRRSPQRTAGQAPCSPPLSSVAFFKVPAAERTGDGNGWQRLRRRLRIPHTPGTLQPSERAREGLVKEAPRQNGKPIYVLLPRSGSGTEGCSPVPRPLLRGTTRSRLLRRRAGRPPFHVSGSAHCTAGVCSRRDGAPGPRPQQAPQMTRSGRLLSRDERQRSALRNPRETETPR